MDLDDSLLDALLEFDPPPALSAPKLAPPPPPRKIEITIDNKTTMPGIGRRCYGGYTPATPAIPVFALPEKPVEVHYDLGMDRIHLRAKEKRDTRIKKQLKKQK